MYRPKIESNHDGTIRWTDYYGGPLDQHGKAFVSYYPDTRTWRLLTPQGADWSAVMDAARAVVSRGLWAEGMAYGAQRLDGIEIVFEDGTPAPFTVHSTTDALDAEPAEDSEHGTLCIYMANGGQLQIARRMPCLWQRVRDI